ncbi:hypothetical protein JCM21714_2149 [Gracilibacillus boraciitolerans JCM 21714]|uniref:Peptidase n=1 Tax=Gracilibacillus boraciitolerans JCM 21714 TaxID=1298598 RepID=W4VIY5_9BACI|nr:prolyl oligopeptidase family serine peptidase [Gracilibacillus boraciitolerans]GAE93111.1 hypothetical protein JCM21714_2149 [Gracilibacillus boraciitolerans JCM 21714]
MNRSYKTVTEVTDWGGPYVTKLILPLPESVESEILAEDTFNVYVERRNKINGDVLELRKDFTSEEKYLSKGYCKVIKTYASDEKGNIKVEGKYATLELECEPIYRINSEIALLKSHNEYVYCNFYITQIKEIKTKDKILGLVYDQLISNNMDQIKGWTNSEPTNMETSLRYGYYKPIQNKGEHPLIIWLHGAGEGGYDTTIAYTGNNVVNLSSDKIQQLFNGAYVLAPQVPTMWMDDGTGKYTMSGKSKYVKALKLLIDEFIDVHSNIDENRMYIGGCSNGGFMTMRMIIDYPGFFTAAFPVCEALQDDLITDEQITDIKNTPIWFTHTKNDTIVDPNTTVIPTYKRLLKAGASDVHFTFFDKIVDNTGTFTDEGDKPFEFFGHASWIYMLKDKCTFDYDDSPVNINGKNVSLLQWLALQNK